LLSPRQRFVVALLPPFVALAVQLALWSLITPYVWFLFFPAMFVSSWIGGRKTGLLATALAASIVWVVFVSPRGDLVKGSPRELFPVVVFGLMGLAFTSMHERLRRTTSDLREANARVQSLLARSLELDRLKSDFFANVSHELRTPLTLILGPVRRMLGLEGRSSHDRDQLHLVERNAQVLLRLVDELLEAASLESGGAALSYARTDLAALARLVAGQFAGLAQEREIALRVDADAPVPADLDSDRVQRALTNLVANAFKFTPHGGVVRVTVRACGDAAVLEVADSGPGIAPADREVVLERFRQVDSAATRRYGGVGLGLAIVHEVVALHSGRTVIAEAPEGGALFRLELPITAPEEAEVREERPLAVLGVTGGAVTSLREGAPAAVPEAGTVEAGRSRLGSVLVVEDNAELNGFLCEVLGESYDVVPAYDGTAGLAAVRTHRPTVVVTDVMMPGVSGEDLLRAIRQDPQLAETPVLVLTAKDDRSLMVRLLQEGANDYLVKPFTVEELRARLDNLVRLRLLDQERQRAQDRAEGFLQAAPDATVVVDVAGAIVRVNRQAEATFGYPMDELVGQPVEVLLPLDARGAHPELRGAFLQSPHARTMGSGLELSARRKDGSLLPVDVSLSPVHTPDGPLIIAAVRDVSVQRSVQDQLRHLALHDALTGLPNRVLLLEHLSEKIAELERVHGCVAVMFVDVDRFKQVNDQYGHTVGDEVLNKVATRLQRCLRPQDTVARLGGDEFAVACGLVNDEREALVLAERIVRAMDPPLQLDGRVLQISVSVGVAVARSSAAAGADLLRYADTAMYQAKQRGRHRIEVFDEALGRLAVQRAEAEVLLHSALEQDRLRLLYQPMVSLTGQRLGGVEALLRVQGLDGVLIGPEVFLEVAEETGLIVPVGRWVVEEACRQLAAWQRDGWEVPVWLNLSARQLVTGDLGELVTYAVREAGADPRGLGLEITETAFMQATPEVIAQLRELTEAGIGLAIDDFGTGWSSLTYLKDLPVDTIKIDRTFTEGLGVRTEETAIVSSVVRLAQVLGRSVVIEGMETTEQLAYAQTLGCDLAQGYLFSRPLPPAEVRAWDRNRTRIVLPEPTRSLDERAGTGTAD
jgi:diguanylate cyclase (GGDEF)-like protein/PAS domain S-box-containing protein